MRVIHGIITSNTRAQHMPWHCRHLNLMRECHCRGGLAFPGCSAADAEGSPQWTLCCTWLTLVARPLKGPIKRLRPRRLAPSSSYASNRHPIILSIWSVSVDRHEITSRAFFDNCRYSHKDGHPYWRQSQGLQCECVCVWVRTLKRGNCLRVMRRPAMSDRCQWELIQREPALYWYE